jgi:hypothetical protein
MQLGQAAGGDVEFHLYPRVGHAYMNGESPERQTWLGVSVFLAVAVYRRMH